MGLFSRIAQFLRIRTSAALDKAENPGEVLDYSYNKQLEQLPKVRQSIVEVKTNEKLLESQMAAMAQKVNRLDQQALQALQVESRRPGTSGATKERGIAATTRQLRAANRPVARSGG